MPERQQPSGEWPNEILKNLVSLNSKYEKLSNNFEALCERYDTLEKLITGNGAPEKGLIVRFDRIEQSEKRREGWAKAAIGAAISCVITVVGMLIKLFLYH